VVLALSTTGAFLVPDILTQKNIASLGDIRRLTDHSAATAGGSGAATTVTGLTIDRMGMGTGALCYSAEMSAIYEATLASGFTLSLAYAVQHAPDGSTWADYQTGAAAVVQTATGGALVAKAELNVAVDLNSANRYVRFNYQPTFSNTQNDTFYGDGVGFFAGFTRLPAPTA
jgi:hypothetical protein